MDEDNGREEQGGASGGVAAWDSGDGDGWTEKESGR